VGKSTQANLLEEYLRSLGHDVVRTLEPGGTELGQEIRQLLLHRKGHVAARAEALLFAADRAHHVETKIKPALAAGSFVISDRYFDSSVAYQGAGRELSMDEVRHINVWATGGLLPNLTILLDLDAAAARSRRQATGTSEDRIEQAKLEFFEATRMAFLKLAQAEPERFLVIDANQSIQQMQAQIRSRVSTILG
jgi:dTMP kinase